MCANSFGHFTFSGLPTTTSVGFMPIFSASSDINRAVLPSYHPRSARSETIKRLSPFLSPAQLTSKFFAPRM
jgi:hypothetical protein